MCDSDHKGTGAVSFAVGTAIGAGLGVFFSTKKGKKLIKRAWKELEPYLEDVVDTAREDFEEVSTKAKVKATEYKSKAETKFDQAVEEVKDFADEKLPPSIKKPVKRTFFKGL